tara:strand:- start:336 stop:545 length:210 start_codon:yes stop_codon:yes gene_type:complete
MDKTTEIYLQSLLSDRKRLLKGALKGLSEVKKGNSSIEVDFVLRQETQWELDQIVKAQRALDILTEEGI